MLDYASIPESERIIVALDCDERRARELAEQLVGRATWLKIGMTLFYQAGPTMVANLKDM